MVASTDAPVFMMKDLRYKFQKMLRKHGSTDDVIDRVNVTRLKENIIADIPGLLEQKSGKFTILTSNKFMGGAIFKASSMSAKNEGNVIFNAAKVIRKYLFQDDESFDGDFSHERQTKSVPQQLVLLLGLILEQSEETSISESTTNLALKLAQLVRFNSVKTKRKSKHNRRTKINEPPLPVLLGLSIHSQTREKKIIDDLHSNGLSISYDRVLEIEDNITNSLCKKYETDGIVCPPSLESGLYTCAAIDNIDHDPSSSTAQMSYHGTSISIFQFPDNPSQHQKFRYSEEAPKKTSLPDYFTQVMPTKDLKSEHVDRSNKSTMKESSKDMSEIRSWLKQISTSLMNENQEERISFSSYFSKECSSRMPTTISSLLPLLNESINSTAMVRHCIEVIQRTTRYLNADQKVLITADQPVYALGKQVQWMYNERYMNVVWLMGPLHVEMAYMSAIGNWVNGSGWVAAFEKANITTTGRIESFFEWIEGKENSLCPSSIISITVEISPQSF